MPADHPPVPSSEHNEIPIPQPPPTMLLGNFPDMVPGNPAGGMQRLAELYGPIYQLALDRRTLVVSNQELIHELSDQNRFHKDISRTLMEIRALTGDGLFTASHEDTLLQKKEPNWWKAHRLLIPAFGPLGIQAMFPEMLDISSQMILRWDREMETSAGSIDCSDQFTRLAFDTIGLCSFGYRFNEFYSDEPHPFAKQMTNVLKLSGLRANRTEVENSLHHWQERDRQADVSRMHGLARDIIAERKRNPQPDANDLLNLMLYAKDRETGETLDEENVLHNMITFLVAGHETTSATLSFMWYNFLKHPETFFKAQKQVDEVVGDKVISVDMLPKLTYIDAAIKETLRLSTPIQVPTSTSKADTYIGGGKYKINKNDNIVFNLRGLHHDPAVWGEDHNEFKPERFLNGGFQALPPDSWKPFGTGLRACIGRGFSEQEMLLNTAMIHQRFSPEMADPSYELKTRVTLTMKPDGFRMKVRRRLGRGLYTGIPGSTGQTSETRNKSLAVHNATQDKTSDAQVKIFFGGNSGTCEGFAQNMETSLSNHGVTAEIDGLDSATENLSTEVINLIITASYEGQPPDNARKFVSWLENLKKNGKSDTLKDVKYSVMGVGNSDWTSTFHRIPKLVDELMQELGAETIAPIGLSNVKTDLIGPFEEWEGTVVESITGKEAVSNENENTTLNVTIDRADSANSLDGDHAGIGTVLENRILVEAKLGFAKQHLRVRLPAGASYQAGDYLAVQPRNSDDVVGRVLRYFGYDDRTNFSVEGSNKKYLPASPMSVQRFLKDRVELGTPGTKRQLAAISKYATDEKTIAILNDPDEVVHFIEKRYNIMDILHEFSIILPFTSYMDMLVPLTPRQYSISSSPLVEDFSNTVTITYDVQTDKAKSGHGIFSGACSTYLASRQVGNTILCSVKPTNVGFRLPGDLQVPIVMFAAGTGIAPMRAFLLERQAIAQSNPEAKLGKAILFYGCRDAEIDYLYKDELKDWEEQGIVTVYTAYSRMPESGCPKYVQDAAWAHRDEVAELFSQGGKIYLCGSAARLGQSCASVCKKIWMERTGKGEEEAATWLDSIKTDRYVSDVY